MTRRTLDRAAWVVLGALPVGGGYLAGCAHAALDAAYFLCVALCASIAITWHVYGTLRAATREVDRYRERSDRSFRRWLALIGAVKRAGVHAEVLRALEDAPARH